MAHNLAARAPGPELMDAADVAPADLEHALAHLETINRLLNGYGPTLSGLQEMLPKDCRAFRLLDVGCGSGDTLRRIAEWARGKRIETQLVGLELSPVTAERAARLCADYPEITILCADFFSLQSEPYDIVHSALVMHHLDDATAARALQKMSAMAIHGVIVNDLHRHWFAYRAIQMLTRTFSRSHILRHDAPLSVARSFTREELLDLATRAELRQPKVQWHWAFRWLLLARGAAKPAHAEGLSDAAAG